MLFDPSILARRPLEILTVVLIIMLGKPVAAFLIVLVRRYPLGAALIVAASLAQIGEFSFILADLGIALRLLPSDGQSLVVAGALISIVLNSLLVREAAAVERRFKTRPANVG
jgi:CPA2 family monovalent cation:H+ antiporter-2